MKNKGAADNLHFSSTLVSQENGEEIEFRDPYGVCSEFGNRDIGSYRRLFSIEPGAINPRAFLEHGIPERAEMVVELMRKTISKGAKNDEMAVRNKFGLELSEPLVSFALCCGSWSSPADLESLLDWICLQLPCELGEKAINCQERGKKEPHSQFVRVMPYELSYRFTESKNKCERPSNDRCTVSENSSSKNIY
ncbi:hypothetical protein OIU85_020909 [Salix viminalis]|uniref:Uncharacterized protein n=1 Tax=Salix viminalis TaxID=40686 RepID=A0A9Q0UHD8_SALVM|nr:hypothetical protein OIU85_020909 [Salix viminalis]